MNQFTSEVFLLSTTGPENWTSHCESGGLAPHKCINAISVYVVSAFQGHVRLWWKFLRREYKFLISDLLVVSEEIAVRILKEKCWKCWNLNWKEFIFTWIQKVHLIWPFSGKIRTWNGILKSSMTKTWITSNCLCVLLHWWQCKPDRHTADLGGKWTFPVVFYVAAIDFHLVWLNSIIQAVEGPLKLPCPNSGSEEI